MNRYYATLAGAVAPLGHFEASRCSRRSRTPSELQQAGEKPHSPPTCTDDGRRLRLGAGGGRRHAAPTIRVAESFLEKGAVHALALCFWHGQCLAQYAAREVAREPGTGVSPLRDLPSAGTGARRLVRLLDALEKRSPHASEGYVISALQRDRSWRLATRSAASAAAPTLDGRRSDSARATRGNKAILNPAPRRIKRRAREAQVPP